MAPVPERLRVPLEIGIIFAVAAAVEFLPGGEQTLDAVVAAIFGLFGVGIFLAALMQYREHRVGVYSLGDARRALLYGTIAVLVVTLVAQPRMWETSLGEFFWFALVGLCIYSFVAIYRFARRY